MLYKPTYYLHNIPAPVPVFLVVCDSPEDEIALSSLRTQKVHLLIVFTGDFRATAIKSE